MNATDLKITAAELFADPANGVLVYDNVLRDNQELPDTDSS